jgi:hypothetical protein
VSPEHLSRVGPSPSLPRWYRQRPSSAAVASWRYLQVGSDRQFGISTKPIRVSSSDAFDHQRIPCPTRPYWMGQRHQRLSLQVLVCPCANGLSMKTKAKPLPAQKGPDVCKDVSAPCTNKPLACGRLETAPYTIWKKNSNNVFVPL